MDTVLQQNNHKTRIKESFQNFENGLNGMSKTKFHQVRKNAMEHFERLGLPDTKHEEYKYTAIAKVLNKQFSSSEPGKSINVFYEPEKLNKFIIDHNAINLFFVDGKLLLNQVETTKASNSFYINNFENAYNTYSEDIDAHFAQYADPSLDGFIALNTAFATNGLFLKLKKDSVVDKPVYLHYFYHSPENHQLVQIRNLILCEANSELKVVELHHNLSGNEVFANIVTEAVVEENAFLDYYKIQKDNDQNYQVNTTHIIQNGKSTVNTLTFTMGGAIIRNNLKMILNAEHCESNLFGLYVLHSKSLTDNHTLVDHRAPNSYSNELYKGIIDQNATGVFNGKIYVQQEAQKTNAFQSNKNILLTDEANIYTKPQLEIWADDVKCSHGCTTGQLDEDQMFYLRSRGLSIESARAILLLAFAEDVVEKIKLEPLKNFIKERIYQRLQ
jgi:Fe-S cluster assembly protein SufD